jgi:uncharacterized protein YaiI (UPF0178 family)
MAIWVDADACPRPVKEILFKAAERTGIELTLVANHAMAVPRLPNVRLLQVQGGFDVADQEIARRVAPDDLVVTADTIRALLTMRDFMDTMRASGVVTGGPPALSQADRQAFAGQLDRWLARRR